VLLNDTLTMCVWLWMPGLTWGLQVKQIVHSLLSFSYWHFYYFLEDYCCNKPLHWGNKHFYSLASMFLFIIVLTLPFERHFCWRRTQVFCDVMLCSWVSWVSGSWSFKWMHCLHLQGCNSSRRVDRRILFFDCLMLRMMVLWSFRAAGTTHSRCSITYQKQGVFLGCLLWGPQVLYCA
jgi:hypothetical protein